MLYFEIKCENCDNIFSKQSITPLEYICCPECKAEEVKILRCNATTKLSITNTNK